MAYGCNPKNPKDPLDWILNQFPDNDVIDDLKADAGYGYRSYSMHAYDSAIVGARKELAFLRSELAEYKAALQGAKEAILSGLKKK